MTLDMDRHVEEEDLGFREVNFHAESITEEVDHRVDSKSFLDCGDPH